MAITKTTTDGIAVSAPATPSVYIYANKASLMLLHDARTLVQLTNDNDAIDCTDSANINESALASAENEAAQTINNFLRNIYLVPLTGADLTAEIITICGHLTWCGLWERRGEEPEQVTKLRDRNLKRLADMGKPEAEEVRGVRETATMPVRSTRGKAKTVFQNSGYFDGVPGINDRRRLPADTEGEEGE
jgi:phage gp36-like protein